MRGIASFIFVVAAAGCAQCQSEHIDRPAVDSGAAQPNEAQITAATGQVSRLRDAQTWALSAGESVPVRQVITTGADGYARVVVAGGSSCELFAHSSVIFRRNTAAVGDLLDITSGRVRVHLQTAFGQARQRIFTPVAVISTHQPATLAIAIDEDDTVRIDVIEGEVRVQHTRLPRNEPTIVRAADAILVRPDEQISRQVDRGSLYRYTVKSLHDIWSSIWPGHAPAHDDGPIEQNKLLAER